MFTEQYNPALAAIAMAMLNKKAFVGMGPEGPADPAAMDPAMAAMGGGGGDPAAMDPAMAAMGIDPAMLEQAMMAEGGGDPAAMGMPPEAPPMPAGPDPMMMEMLSSIQVTLSNIQATLSAMQAAPAASPEKKKAGGNSELAEKIDNLAATVSSALGLPDPNAPAQPPAMPPAGMPPGMPMPAMGMGAPTGMEVMAAANRGYARNSAIKAAIDTLLKR